jgi:RsiW-degrading membrane proteinase PrsW (M82 family)
LKKSEVTIELHKPGIRELLFFLLSGAVVSVPLTLFIEQNFATPLLTGLSAFDITIISVAIFAPFVEEFAKVFPLFYRHGETQRSIFTLALFSGIGFGIVEFITYVATFGPQIIPARVPGLFFHPAATSITAYGIATKRPLPFYLAAVSLHFANNFFAITAPPILPISVVVLAISLFASWQLHDRTQNKFVETDHATCT